MSNPYALFSHSVPGGYLTPSNIEAVSDMVTKEIARFYGPSIKIVIPKHGIVRFLIYTLEERIESVPKMNRRTVMKLSRDFLNTVAANEQANNFSNNVWKAWNRSPELGIKPYSQIKMNTADSLGERPGMRFHYTF